MYRADNLKNFIKKLICGKFLNRKKTDKNEILKIVVKSITNP